MESYLKGKDFSPQQKTAGFSPYPGGEKLQVSAETSPDLSAELVETKEIIYETEGAPKVEVVSHDGKPVRLLIHIEQDKILEIDCLY